MKPLYAVAALLLVGACDGPTAPGPAIDYANADNAFHCVNGLTQAAEAEQADSERSALAFPWRITGEDKNGTTRLTCVVENRDREAIVVVDAVCEDTDDLRCTRLVSFTQAPGAPAS